MKIHLLNDNIILFYDDLILVKNDAVSIVDIEKYVKLRLIYRTTVNKLQQSNLKKVEIMHKYRDVFRG